MYGNQKVHICLGDGVVYEDAFGLKTLLNLSLLSRIVLKFLTQTLKGKLKKFGEVFVL